MPIPSARRQMALAGVVLAAVAGSQATGQTVLWGGRAYGLTTTAGTWLQAEAEAVALGGHLLAINSAGESSFIVGQFLAVPPPDARPYWIGLSDHAVEGAFQWSTGEPLTFLNWHLGEPNDAAPGEGEDFVAINWHRSQGLATFAGEWNDVPLAGTAQGSEFTDGPYRGVFELPPLAGDFDEDGAVGGADLARWRGGFGAAVGASHGTGDADADGDADGLDFLAWQRERGLLRLAAVAAPEPRTLPVGLGAACALARGRRGRPSQTVVRRRRERGYRTLVRN